MAKKGKPAKKQKSEFFDEEEETTEAASAEEDTDEDEDEDDDEDEGEEWDGGTLNLEDDVDESDADWSPLAAGTYPGLLDDFEYGKSQAKGNPMITWIFVTNTDEKETDNRKLYYHTVLNSSRGLAQVKKLINRLGPDKVDMKQFDPNTSPEALVGSPCRLKVRVRKYQGEMRNDLRDILVAKHEGSEFFDKE